VSPFNIGVVDRFEVDIGTGFELVDNDTAHARSY